MKTEWVSAVGIISFVSTYFRLALDEFARNPTLQQLNMCRKVDLMLIANLFNMQSPLTLQAPQSSHDCFDVGKHIIGTTL